MRSPSNIWVDSKSNDKYSYERHTDETHNRGADYVTMERLEGYSYKPRNIITWKRQVVDSALDPLERMRSC